MVKKLNKWLAVCFVLFVGGYDLINQSPALAQSSSSETILMVEVSSGDEPPPVDVQIIGGEKIDPKFFPSTLKFPFGEGFNVNPCTATIVGSNVVFTAAHCRGEKFAVKLKNDEKEFILSCERHDKFDSSTLKNDLMICLSERPFPTIHKFESINVNPVKINTDLFFLGYGCRDLQNPVHTLGSLMGGVVKVSHVSSDHVITTQQQTDVPSEPGQNVMVCFGDSGGGVYVLPTGNYKNSSRSIIGVVSALHRQNKQSFVSAFFMNENLSFINKWIEKNPSARICGLNSIDYCNQ